MVVQFQTNPPPSPNDTVHVNEQNQKNNKTKSRHIQIDHVFYFSIYLSNHAMVSLKDALTVWL